MQKYIFALLTISTYVFSQDKEIIDELEKAYQKATYATMRAVSFWGTDLTAPVLFIDPATRTFYATHQNKENSFAPIGKLYSGLLPKDIPIANTSLHWAGINWAMVVLPLPRDEFARTNLITHEMFHVHQKSIGFTQANAENNHLDDFTGRLYLRMELEALKAALQTKTYKESKYHIQSALLYRKIRHDHYAGSVLNENALELNEGLAEFTGMMLSGRNETQRKNHLIKEIEMFQQAESFVRNFAYITIPAYGYFLSKIKGNWTRSINGQTDLTKYLYNSFGAIEEKDLNNTLSQHNHAEIEKEETERSLKIEERRTEYRKRFIENPHLEISLQNMNISFNPGNLISLGEYGTVYPTLWIKDDWGILTVTDGALMAPEWNKIVVSKVDEVNNKSTITGQGYTLTLNEGYSIFQDIITKVYFIKKIGSPN